MPRAHLSELPIRFGIVVCCEMIPSYQQLGIHNRNFPGNHDYDQLYNTVPSDLEVVSLFFNLKSVFKTIYSMYVL